MFIVRFGADYDTAYAFPRYGERDQWSISRPAMYTRVGGLSGAFDFYGDLNSPYAALTFRKSMLVAGTTPTLLYQAIEVLRTATIGVDESYLWLLGRNDALNSIRAKCVSLKIADAAGHLGYVPAEVEFFCREGRVTGIYLP